MNIDLIDLHAINADLHCHSRVSDGTLAPAKLAQRAFEHGVQLWSLTDHDEIGGQDEARQAAEALGMRYLSGVEISVTWARETLHIVGLGFDAHSAVLAEGLEKVRSGRSRRAQAIAEQLAASGIPEAFAGALKYVGNPNLISRTHFARFLVEKQICPDVHAVFSNYLVLGKPGYVPMRWASLPEAVGWIHAAGGVAVIAHPGRYRLTELEMHELLREFKELGGAAIEVVTGSHTIDQYRQYAAVAREYDLLASRGSDFHSPDESHTELGTLPPLPDSVVPVWQNWF
ncbi:MAG: 3',5'-nucleoside bisphosphate phosphatase [Burkholderiaceae bacterium]|jgi:predicted metal-dependent phosphoesterase TrpH